MNLISGTVSRINDTLVMVGPAPYTPEWFALRQYDPERVDCPVLFGASEAAAVMGVSQYVTAYELYLKKRGEFLGTDSPEMVEAQEMGLELEPIALRRYSKATLLHVQRDVPLLRHYKHSFMACTPDALVVRDDQAQWLVDAKTTTHFMWDRSGEDETKYGRDGTDEVPLDALFQAQQQMAVTGLQRCDFAVLFNGRNLRVFTVNRDESLIDALVMAERELAERIVSGDPPEPQWSHPGTRRLIQDRQGVELGTSITLAASYRAMWERAEELKDEIAAAETERDALRLQVLAESGLAECVYFADSPLKLKKVSVRESTVSPSDVIALQAKLGQVKRSGYVYLRKSS